MSGGGRSLPSANPDNVAAGGATDARCGGGRGERRVHLAPRLPFRCVSGGGSMKNSALSCYCFQKSAVFASVEYSKEWK